MGELLGLKWEDFDERQGTLVIRRQLQWLRVRAGEPHRPSLTEPKSAKGRRTIHLPSAAIAALRDHLRGTARPVVLATAQLPSSAGQGAHPKLVQEQLGHSRISVTLDTYSYATAPMMREAATKMDAILAPHLADSKPSGRRRSR